MPSERFTYIQARDHSIYSYFPGVVPFIFLNTLKKALQSSQQALLVNNQILYLLNLRSLLKVRYQNVLLEMFQRALLT